MNVVTILQGIAGLLIISVPCVAALDIALTEWKGERMEKNQKFDIPDNSQAYIVANLPEGEKNAIVVFKGNTRKLISVYAFAGAKIAENLKAQGLKEMQIRDALIGTFTTAVDAALKGKKKGKESNHEES